MYYIKKKKKPLFDKTEPKQRKKSRQTLINKLDRLFSLYIRLRDSKRYSYKYFRCISCGNIQEFSKADAGHYMSRKHMSTRFDEMNVHCECRACNRFSADHIVAYRRNLVALYGEAKVQWIEAKAKQSCKITDFELEQLIVYYDALVKRMKAERDGN